MNSYPTYSVIGQLNLLQAYMARTSGIDAPIDGLSDTNAKRRAEKIARVIQTLNVVREAKDITPVEIAERLGLRTRAINCYLNELEASHKVKRAGRERNGNKIWEPI